MDPKVQMLPPPYEKQRLLEWNKWIFRLKETTYSQPHPACQTSPFDFLQLFAFCETYDHLLCSASGTGVSLAPVLLFGPISSALCWLCMLWLWSMTLLLLRTCTFLIKSWSRAPREPAISSLLTAFTEGVFKTFNPLGLMDTQMLGVASCFCKGFYGPSMIRANLEGSFLLPSSAMWELGTCI